MEYFSDNNWQSVLSGSLETDETTRLLTLVEELYQSGEPIFPKREELFKAFDACPFSDLKVVILGQDPYPTAGHADGLSFSVEETVRPFPKSLNNIFKELYTSKGLPLPENGNLERWAKQGVFLLNSILTVEEGKAGSHAKIGWGNFTDEVIKTISNKKEHVVFLLWGAFAGKKEALIDADKHLILKSVHPSPLSAYRGFFGCNHFDLANDYLKSNNLMTIKW
jgi:uracil-DNA glycosylase